MLYHPLIDKILCTRTGCWTPTPPGYDVYVNLHGVIEQAPFGTHGVDAFARSAGLQVTRRTPKLYLEGRQCLVETEDDRYPIVSHPPIVIPNPVDITVHIPHEPRNVLWKRDIISEIKDYFEQAGESLTIRIVGQDPIEPGKSHMLKMAHEIDNSRMFIGPDSAGFHIAAALNVPAVVSLTDKFPPSMRGYSKTICVGDYRIEDLLQTSLALYRNLDG
jgi:hypothetical protein